MGDYNLTLFEACEYLNRSKKSLSRYIRRGLLHPEKIKSQQGTLEYRFSKDDLEAFKAKEKQDKTRRETRDRTDKTIQRGQTEATPIKEAEIKEITGQTRQDKTRQDSDIINLLKETTGLLKDQLAKKDEQIKDLSGKIDELIQRNRETNILIGQLQSKILMFEKPKAEQTRQDKPDKPLKRKKTKQAKPKAEAKKPEKKGFWHNIFK